MRRAVTELIPYHEFGALTLTRFLGGHPALAAQVTALEDWEYMGHMWVGEGAGAFTDFLRLASRPGELGAMTLDFPSLPRPFSEDILDALRLPVRPGMSQNDITLLLGEPERRQRFVADRESLEFTIGQRWPYHVDCTVHEAEGLIYLAVIRKDILERCSSD